MHENIICIMLSHYPCPLQKLLSSKVPQVKQTTVSYNSQFSTEVDVVCTTLLWSITSEMPCEWPRMVSHHTNLPIPVLSPSCHPFFKNSLNCFGHAQFILLLHLKWNSMQRLHFKAAGPIQSLLLKLYNHISLRLAACTYLTSDGEQAQQANPAESLFPLPAILNCL